MNDRLEAHRVERLDATSSTLADWTMEEVWQRLSLLSERQHAAIAGPEW